MPSNEHELTVELFRDQPALVPGLLRDVCGLVLPGCAGVREESGSLADLSPATFSADAVFVLSGDAGDACAVIVEVQRGIDRRRGWVWLSYLANLRTKLELPVLLLVVCLDEATAKWARQSIETGHPGLVFTPVVVGPASLPVISDPERVAAEPHLATLAALAHRHDPRLRAKVLEPLLATLIARREEKCELYADYVVSGLDAAVRPYWEEFMSQLMESYKEAFRAKYEARAEARGEARGKAQGEAEAVLAVLAARGVQVSDAAAASIKSCRDTDQLKVWIGRAVTASSVVDLFAS